MGDCCSKRNSDAEENEIQLKGFWMKRTVKRLFSDKRKNKRRSFVSVSKTSKEEENDEDSKKEIIPNESAHGSSEIEKNFKTNHTYVSIDLPINITETKIEIIEALNTLHKLDKKLYDEKKMHVIELLKKVLGLADDDFEDLFLCSRLEWLIKEFYHLDNETNDTIAFRKGYPDLIERTNSNENFLFYTEKISSKPDKVKITDILKEWRKNYELLEDKHGYIQWLFPIREQGVNSESKPLRLEEIENLLEDPDFLNKLKQSYELMLDFYGMKFKNPDTGELCRTDNYQERYENLSTRSHNYLRITRILKCLGEFSLESYQVEFIRFLAYEVFVSKELQKLAFSLRRFWVHTIKDDQKRMEIINYIKILIIDNFSNQF